MDPLSADRVHERTLELQRTADQVRQERKLRSTPESAITRSESRRVEERPATAKVGACSPAEPAI